jgi:hypothetical protein
MRPRRRGRAGAAAAARALLAQRRRARGRRAAAARPPRRPRARGAAPRVRRLAVRGHELEALSQRVDGRLALAAALCEAPDQLADLRRARRAGGVRGRGGGAGARRAAGAARGARAAAAGAPRVAPARGRAGRRGTAQRIPPRQASCRSLPRRPAPPPRPAYLEQRALHDLQLARAETRPGRRPSAPGGALTVILSHLRRLPGLRARRAGGVGRPRARARQAAAQAPHPRRRPPPATRST